ncbi:uncharacterized protein HMPREF1541_10004 [Cyphellophora europaea CBS 101466]|uniref:UV radiation resistance-associated gene protein n=1 Tax=Cyphellophora europaea (strain CBS 101466) TaxID=1220924 RepID=W2S8X2_CYPE1|nr:uncharacterized protein HMPREF1541_10004 [Cyphellophora europaea CBS 101466]ETN45127.1 hypothetical protein HMPREF1541_10004 [Cyphellophora europaea CBS 101466]
MSDHDLLLSGSITRHEKPLLFPWNRRLRHLHGISLRNLNITAVSSRARGKTTTDDDAPYNLDTPTKRALRSEARTLTHSASFTSLASANKDRPSPLQKASTSYVQDGKTSLGRPQGRLRRRSTLHWSSATPRARQEKLQDLTGHRLLDTWFSLHIGGAHETEPVYLSEVMESCMNPSFAFFDLDTAGPLVARADECVLRLWAKTADAVEYVVLVELNVNLRSLQFIGATLDNFHHPLPENCVLLHLSDGIYTSFTDLPGSGATAIALREAKSGSVEASSSFDALMQLANLDECIQDAMKVRQRLEDEVNDLLAEQTAARDQERSLRAKRQQLASAKSAAVTVRKQNAALQRRNEELRLNLKTRQETVSSGSKPQKEAEKHNQEQRELIQSLRAARQTAEESQGQMRRIGEALQSIFPIEPIGNKPLQFTIRNVSLPNSAFDDTNRDEIAAALGFTAQLVHQLSLYLLCSLPYPLEPNASNSWIQDPVSAGLAQRRYPLYPTSVAYKFEYGVFLLNKDIEFLMNKVGLRVLDIRHTLPNLKYLLYVLTAGSGELPERKAGGIRGLLGGRMTPSASRRSSQESVKGHREILKPAQRNGHIGSREKPNDPFSSSPPMPKLAYRSSGLRDAG